MYVKRFNSLAMITIFQQPAVQSQSGSKTLFLSTQNIATYFIPKCKTLYEIPWPITIVDLVYLTT